MRSAKLFGLILVALSPVTFAHTDAREALLAQVSTPKIQNFSPVQTAVITCTWTCSGIRTETLCPSGTHCSCTCTSAGPFCECVVPP
jgi:hypothetical protein